MNVVSSILKLFYRLPEEKREQNYKITITSAELAATAI